MPLKAITPKKAEPKRPKILIYGKPGAGKTFAALDFPSTYYIDTEGGANLNHYTDKLQKSGGVYLGVEQGALDFDTVIEQVKELGKQKHEYKTLVIDSISKLYNSSIGDEMERLGDKDQFGASKRKPVAQMRKLVNWLSRIDMNVILIAHEKAEWGQDSSGQRVEIGATFDAWDKLEYELDLCLNIIKVAKKRNAFIRKSRLEEFPELTHFEWSYENFAKKYGEQVIEKETETLDLATPEQVKKIKQLIKTVKLPEGTEEKWFKKSNVDGWEEMDSDRVDAAINHINQKYLNADEKE